MRLKRLITCLIISIFLAYLFPKNVSAEEVDLGITAKSCVLMEMTTGDILYEKNSNEALPPASITKIMTLLLIYDAIEEGKIAWEDMVTVSEYASKMGGSQVFLEPGEVQSVHELTKCIAIASANDAAVAMAEYIGGSETGFVGMMNEKAKALGMKNTVFVNACGLPAEGHVTSALDIGIMSRELMGKYPKVSEFTTTWMDTIIHKTKRGESEFGLTNTNKLIKWYNGATGLKTGFTNEAGFCLSGTAKRDGVEMIAVIMGSPDSKTRFKEVINLLDFGFANYEICYGVKSGEIVGEIEIHKGKISNIGVAIGEDFSLVTKKGGENKLSYEISIYPYLNAPVSKGSPAGEIIYLKDGKEVGSVPLIISENVERLGFLGTLEALFKRAI